MEVKNPIESSGKIPTLQSVEEPYFQERYPGKVCILCNLGERSQLGQGELLRLKLNEPEKVAISQSVIESENNSQSVASIGKNAIPLSNRRQKIICKIKSNNEYVDELQKIGYTEQIEFMCLLDSNNYYYIHRLCATWSSGVQREPNGVLKKIEVVVSQSLQKKCSYCNHYGASLVCKMTCPKIYHFPCASAVGGLQIISNYISFCPEHVHQAPLIYDFISCRICSSRGNVTNLVICSTCGDLYHGTCIGLPKTPGARAGWQCKSCKKCQICRLPDAIEGRSIDCEHCQKMYHANCLRPVLTSIPKYGWKCRCCRICSDCGSRTPGAGASSRWHAHYTVCDSCYQQRNKGYSCPICHRAYRAAAQKEMVKCAVCNKHVHSSCDSDADLKAYCAKKEATPEYQYICPPCKSVIQSGKYSKTRQQFEEELLPTTQDSNNLIDEAEFDCTAEKSTDVGLGKGKPFAAIKMVKKRMGLGNPSSNRGKSKNAFSKKPRNLDSSRKRGTRGKIRHFYGIPYRPEQQIFPNNDKNMDTIKVEEEPGGENRLVLCSVKNKFVFSQDVCVMCGAIGTDQEGCLIACVQCGQCYHPYCVTVKVTTVILQKGWRCLDCTVCEGCGQKNDESRLLLCDECDISFHTYCMDPPLESVPTGVWKCKWCATCEKCGKSSEMVRGALKKNNIIECEQCISREICPMCTKNYINQDLIINCSDCEKWLHWTCDRMFKEESQVYEQNMQTYKCPLCRPKEELIKTENIKTQIESSSSSTPVPVQPPQSSPSDPPEAIYSYDGCHLVDGVYLSDNGVKLIKDMQIDTKKKRRARMNNSDSISKDLPSASGIDSIKMLDEQTILVNSPIFGDQHGAEAMQCDILNSNLNDAISDNGCIKKKRQRNLQKVGIGGFSVRNRQLRKEAGLEKVDQESGILKNDLDRKKKVFKKRAKSKILESYPVYVQEAFFGSTLLNKENGVLFESDSSDNEISPNSLLSLLAPVQLPQIQQQNQPQLHPQLQSHPQLHSQPHNQSQILSSPQIQPQVHMQTQPQIQNQSQVINQPQIQNQASIQNQTTTQNQSQMQNQPQLQIHSQPQIQSQSQIQNQNIQLQSQTKLYVSENSLDKKPLIASVTPEQVLNVTEKLEFTPTSNYTIENTPQFANTNNIITGSIDIRNKINHQSIMNFQQTLQQQSPKIEQPSSQIINLLQGNAQIPYAPNTEKQIIQQQQSPSVQVQSVQNSIHRNSQLDISTFSLSSNNSNDSLISPTASNSSSIITIAPPNKTVDSVNNEISSTLPQEKMRRDEELGEMATISAVLYANTRYPKLKDEFPNWPDRCKQIYKFWRSLSNEAKAPYLQKARDNRSALRMKKIQQNHDRTILNHKALKEQEQERLWKLHQFRAKEQQYSTDPPQLLQQQPQQQQNPNNAITQVTQTSQISQVGHQVQSITQVPQQLQQLNQITQISHLNQVPTQLQQQIQQVKQIQQMQQAQQVQQNQPLVQQVIQVSQIQQMQQQQQQHVQQNSPQIIKEVSDSSSYQKVPYIQLQQQSQLPLEILNDPTKKTTYIPNELLKTNKIFNIIQQQETNSIRKIPTPVPNAVVFPNTNEPELSIKKSIDVEEDSDFFENIDNADDLLSSLTSDLGSDFNILEYADTDLDALIDQGNQQLFDKLDIESDLDKAKMTQEVLSEEDLLLQTSLDPSISTNLLDIKTRLDISDNPMNFLNIITTNNNVGQISHNICPPVTVPPPPYPGPPPPYPSSENKS